ncbi:hypothetical protein WAI453_009527 [Rhynchosporium graminicola]
MVTFFGTTEILRYLQNSWPGFELPFNLSLSAKWGALSPSLDIRRPLSAPFVFPFLPSSSATLSSLKASFTK